MESTAPVITNIKDLIEKLSSNKVGEATPTWFRGCYNKDFGLIPTIYRSGKSVSETELLRKFKQNAVLLIEQRPTTPYEWLFVMRQYGILSRLLDWSENPLVALFFAVNQDPRHNGALWFMKPIELNRVTLASKKYKNTDKFLPSFEEDKDIMEPYMPQPGFETQKRKLLPIAFIAPRNTRRMLAQSSVYTIHHLDKRGIEKIFDKGIIRKYEIPRDSKNIIRKELNLLGITEFGLFPEPGMIKSKIESN
jgi:hypothetical protein